MLWFYGGSEIGIPFITTLDCELNYAIFKKDYFTLGEKEMEQISIREHIYGTSQNRSNARSFGSPLWPDVLRKQDTSVSQAKPAISDYKKAVGDPEGVAELMVFYCEQAAGFCDDICSDDEGYFDARMLMFEQALANALSPDRRDDLLSRLDRVRTISHDFGYGVGDDMECGTDYPNRRIADYS